MPLAGLLFLYRNKEAVKYDQILRAALTGDDKATNPHYLMRNSFKAIYMNYRPGSWRVSLPAPSPCGQQLRSRFRCAPL